MEKIRTTVRIAGNNYSMSGYDSEDYMRRVAIHVDRKIQEIMLATRRPLQDAAVLTAVTKADDLLKAQDEVARLRRELDEVRRQMDALKNDTAGEENR